MVQTFENNQLDDDDELMITMMKNTSSASVSSSVDATAVVAESESNLMAATNSLSTTENSKIIHDHHGKKQLLLPSTSTTSTTREYSPNHHEHAMSIVNQLVREGKVASFSASSVKDVSDHHLAVKSLAQLLTETAEEEEHDAMNQPLSPNFLLVIVFKTVRLLDLLHKHHLVYRNLTLENILIEKLQDGNLNVHLNNLDKSIELLIDQQVNLTSTISFQGDEHAVSYNAPLHQYFDFNRNAQITHGYEPPEIIHSTTCEKPFICLKSEIWSLAICILRVLFRKSIIIHPENYVEQLDELFGREVDEDLVATQDESKTIMTCLKEMTRNMLCPNVYERWSCADVIEYICLASTFLKSITQEFLNQ